MTLGYAVSYHDELPELPTPDELDVAPRDVLEDMVAELRESMALHLNVGLGNPILAKEHRDRAGARHAYLDIARALVSDVLCKRNRDQLSGGPLIHYMPRAGEPSACCGLWGQEVKALGDTVVITPERSTCPSLTM